MIEKDANELGYTRYVLCISAFFLLQYLTPWDSPSSEHRAGHSRTINYVPGFERLACPFWTAPTTSDCVLLEEGTQTYNFYQPLCGFYYHWNVSAFAPR